MSADGYTLASTRARKPWRNIQWTAYGYLTPAVVSICILSVLPILYTIYIAFTNYSAMHFMSYQFVGLKNFIELLNPGNPLSTLFLPTFAWTVLYAFCVTVIQYFVGLFLAVILNNKNLREATLYRSLLIIPWAVPGLISLLAWQGLLNDSYGQINALLHSIGLPRIPWQTDPLWARVSVVMVAVWAGFPYQMMVVLGALQAVPHELYEASSMDGANWWQQFTRVTIPAIWKISLPLIIPSFAYNFNNFNGVYLLTGGGPARSDNQFVGWTDNLASAAYKLTLTFNRYDLASAISIILFLLVGILSFIGMKYTKAFEEADT